MQHTDSDIKYMLTLCRIFDVWQTWTYHILIYPTWQHKAWEKNFKALVKIKIKSLFFTTLICVYFYYSCIDFIIRKLVVINNIDHMLMYVLLKTLMSFVMSKHMYLIVYPIAMYSNWWTEHFDKDIMIK